MMLVSVFLNSDVCELLLRYTVDISLTGVYGPTLYYHFSAP